MPPEPEPFEEHPERLGVFLGHPSLQGLPALLEVPGKDGHGPDADEVRKLRELHARWT